MVPPLSERTANGKAHLGAVRAEGGGFRKPWRPKVLFCPLPAMAKRKSVMGQMDFLGRSRKTPSYGAQDARLGSPSLSSCFVAKRGNRFGDNFSACALSGFEWNFASGHALPCNWESALRLPCGGSALPCNWESALLCLAVALLCLAWRADLGLQPAERVHGAAVHSHFEVQVRGCGETGGTHGGDRLAPGHRLPGRDQETRAMGVNR